MPGLKTTAEGELNKGAETAVPAFTEPPTPSPPVITTAPVVVFVDAEDAVKNEVPPTLILPPTPTPPVTIKAPVVVEVDAVEEDSVKVPERSRLVP